MGWVLMSERELRRIEVLSRGVEGRLSVVHAAEVQCCVPRLISLEMLLLRKVPWRLG